MVVRRWRASWSAAVVVAAWLYVAAWIAGLVSFGAGPGTAATDPELDAFYLGHPWSSALQSLLVHGIAALALGVFAVAVWRRRVVSIGWLVAAGVAVALSVAQFVLGWWRSVRTDHPARIVHLIDRIDGLKMLALAAMVVAGVLGLRRHRVIGWPLTAVGGLTASAAIVAGVQYSSGADAVAIAGIALVGLLVWIPAVGHRLRYHESPADPPVESAGRLRPAAP